MPPPPAPPVLNDKANGFAPSPDNLMDEMHKSLSRYYQQEQSYESSSYDYYDDDYCMQETHFTSLDQQQQAGHSNEQPLLLPAQPLLAAPPVVNRARKVFTKKVSFAEDALLYASTRTPDEVKHTWYTAAEYAVFKRERKQTVRMLKTVTISDIEASSDYSFRGFEVYSSIATNKQVQAARQTAKDCVLKHDGSAPDIAAYQQASRPLCEHAWTLGQWDADFVRNMVWSEWQLQQQHRQQQQQHNDWYNEMDLEPNTVVYPVRT